MAAQNSALKFGTSTQSFWRSVGVWLTLILLGYSLFNVIRAVVNPAAFSESFYGMALSSDNSAFVLVYAVRTLFLVLYGFALVLRQDRAALSLFALVAVVMPLGDAALVASAAGPTATIIRHLLIAVFVLATWFMLRRRLQKATTAM